MSLEISKVGVVGCGTMGSGICEVSARAGFDVMFSEISDEAVAAGRERISRSLDRAVERGRMEKSEAAEILERISSTTSLADLRDRDIVFEAVPEHLDLKKKTFEELDPILGDEAILATN